MNPSDIVGTFAAILTTVSYLPQVIKSWKTRKTGDISLWRYVLLASAVFSWGIYGVLLKEWPIILCNSLNFLFSLSILYLKIKTEYLGLHSSSPNI